VLLAAVALLLSACGADTDQGEEGDGNTSSAPSTGTPSTGAPQDEPAGGTGTSAAGGSAVSIQDFAFSPPSLDVAAGTEVTVTNRDEAKHTLTADDDSFDTGELTTGQSGSITVQGSGEIAFHCEIHTSMKGTFRVSG